MIPVAGGDSSSPHRPVLAPGQGAAVVKQLKQNRLTAGDGMSLHFHWFLPTNGDGRDIVGGGHGSPPARPAPSVGRLYLGQIARSAEHLGFEAAIPRPAVVRGRVAGDRQPPRSRRAVPRRLPPRPGITHRWPRRWRPRPALHARPAAHVVAGANPPCSTRAGTSRKASYQRMSQSWTSVTRFARAAAQPCGEHPRVAAHRLSARRFHVRARREAPAAGGSPTASRRTGWPRLGQCRAGARDSATGQELPTGRSVRRRRPLRGNPSGYPHRGRPVRPG